MEFTKLSEVAVVETANDDDKVLIEQNGEIKRVPKTEVGGKGGGGNALIISTEDMATFTANMTLTEAITLYTNKELTGVTLYFAMEGMSGLSSVNMVADYTPMAGFECVVIMNMYPLEMELYWTADGISTEPPM